MSYEGIFSLLAAADVGAYAMSLDQRIVFWSPEAERMLGYPAGEVLGRRCFEVATDPAPEGFTPACLGGCPSIRSLRAGRVPSAVTMQMLCASGERKAVSLTPMVVAGSDVDAPLLVHLFEDRVDEQSSGLAAGAVRDELSQQGSDVVSDHPVVTSAAAGAARLTARELEVLRLVAVGRTTAQIAGELDISEHTVRNHVRHFRRKLNAATKLEAVLTGLRLGILEWM